jgi:Trypsin-like peptidase domain
MLFGDDLTLAAGRLPRLIGTLQRLVAVVPAVCKLTVEFAGGGTQFGTAFRIAPDLLLTNWHVLHRKDDGAPAMVVNAEFGYDEDEDGTLLGGTPIRCAVPRVAGDAADDWLVVRTLDDLDDGWPVLPLGAAVVPAVDSAAYVIQHPYGSRKRVGFVRNQVSHIDDRVVHYLTDTAVGSSGSPVVDATGRLIALHHRGGKPQTVAGKSPIRKKEGIRIPRVTAGLAAAGIAVG